MTPNDLIEINQRAVILLGQIARGPADVIRAALQPRDEDYDAVFVGAAAQRAREGYASFWAAPPAALSKPVHDVVRVVAQRAQDIAASTDFPGGFRRIAPLLAPDYVWCVFKFSGAGGSDVLAYNGLVSLGDRWAWFPKPWRVFDATPDQLESS